MKRLLIILFILLLSIGHINGQCITSFEVQTEVCINENLLFPDSDNEGSYFWDFCSGDLKRQPVASELSSHPLLYRARSLEILKDGENWIGFSIDEPNNQLFRLEFGNNLSSNPVITNLGNPDNILSNAYDLIVKQENDKFYGFIVNLSTNKLIRLDFGNSLLNVPEVIDLENPGGLLNSPKDLEIVIDNNTYNLFIANSNASEIIHYSLGNSLSNNILKSIQLEIPGGDNLSSISFIKECNSFISLISSYSNNKIFYLKFEDGLSGSPEIGELALNTSISYPAKVAIVREGGEYYSLIQSAYPGNLYLFDFGLSIYDLIHSTKDFGNLGIAEYNYALEVVQEGSDWRAFNIALSDGMAGYGRLFEISFQSPCSATQEISSLPKPVDIKYQDNGRFTITKEYTKDGITSTSTQTVNVNVNIAPYVEIITDDAVCANNKKGFIASTDAAVKLEWDFNGEKIYNEDTLEYIFETEGLKNVHLIAEASNGCLNKDIIEFEIYKNPVSSFTYEAQSLCT